MAHPYTGHREMHVGHRRAKTLMRSGGYAVGGRTASKAKEEIGTASCPEPDEDDMPMAGGEMKQGGRLDKRARGGKLAKRQDGGSVPLPKRDPRWASRLPKEDIEAFAKKNRGGKAEKFADGGGAFHKITPSKRKPHMSVNIVNISKGGGGGRRRRGPLGINPGALPLPGPAAPAVPLPGPVGAPAMGPPRFAKGGAIGTMRKGKKAGQGSGEGRLEEFHHMKRR